MLEASWEPYCTAAANATSTAELVSVLTSLIKTARIDVHASSCVIYGHDTRPTSPALAKAIAEGLAVMGSTVIDAGLKTTPQLHYLVRAHNTQGTPEAYGEPSEEGYYEKLSTAFLKLVVSRFGVVCLPLLTLLLVLRPANHQWGHLRSTVPMASELTLSYRYKSLSPPINSRCELCERLQQLLELSTMAVVQTLSRPISGFLYTWKRTGSNRAIDCAPLTEMPIESSTTTCEATSTTRRASEC